jgi:hypothetical protein
MFRRWIVAAAVVVALIALVATAIAIWINNGILICGAQNDQAIRALVPDGSGGAIAVWHDARTGVYDIYAQRVDIAGDTKWTTNGLPICSAMGNQKEPAAVSDGSGGAIMAWHDGRGGTNDIYAQRVDASGTVLWTTDGVAICTAAYDQANPTIASDGVGGAIITWYDGRTGSDTDIYAQRVDASGTVLWATDGVAVCTATGDQTFPQISRARFGGAIITWEDRRTVHQDIYAQRIDLTGTTQWTADGVAICTNGEPQNRMRIAEDGAGGAIITWQDQRTLESDIYAQRIDVTGAVRWTADGVAVCTATGTQDHPDIDSDGVGGAIITWVDRRSGGYDAYAQRVDQSGSTLWTADGVVVCDHYGVQNNPYVAGLGSGESIIVWRDQRTGNYDGYAQRVDALGVRQWAADGVPLRIQPFNVGHMCLVANGMGGITVAWDDYRNGTDNDIYAQSVDANGEVGTHPPSIHSILDVPGDQGGWVNLAWYADSKDPDPSVDITEYTIWRALSVAQAAALRAEGASLVEGAAGVGGAGFGSGEPVVRVERAGSATYFWELVDSQIAYRLQTYAKIVPTAFDSTAVSEDYNYFQVIAHTSDPYVFYVSIPDSGYSVDNIAPAAPQGLAGQQSAPEALELTWLPNAESDVSHYHVYRGASAGFTPDPGNRIGAPTDPEQTDGDWRWDSGFWYKVTAVDTHGNESVVATLGPDIVVGTESDTPAKTHLAQNAPNPFNPSTTISFGVSDAADVTLRIYDASGRLVRTLADGPYDSGQHEEVWNGLDNSGHRVASGVYFYVLETGNKSYTRKMLLLK